MREGGEGVGRKGKVREGREGERRGGDVVEERMLE